MTLKDTQKKQDKPSQDFTLTKRDVRSRIIGVRSDVKGGFIGEAANVIPFVNYGSDSGTGDWD